jgi:hypothetical protein
VTVDFKLSQRPDAVHQPGAARIPEPQTLGFGDPSDRTWNQL